MDSISLNLALINAQQHGDHMGAQMIMNMQTSDADATETLSNPDAIDASDMQTIAQIIAQALGLETTLDPQQLLATSDPNVFLLEAPEALILPVDEDDDMIFTVDGPTMETMH